MGLVGQFALSLAKLNGGLPVIAVDKDPFRLDVARSRGADACLNPDADQDIVSTVRDLCVEDGVNVVIEATGIPSVYPMAVKLACIAGRFVALGSPRGTVEFNFLDELHLREVSMLGAIHPKTPEQDHIYFRWTKDRERNLILRMMADGRLSAEDLATHVAAPEECQDIYTMLADNPQESKALGVLFNWKS
jgi:threonine dehydrogenase-like Zn-dependent dehydrogenase